ncbi:hypothetical protein [Bhargavaea ginsengi]|uniref:hypothetical protein n=1 Tax=Bhargavaea ginsengi TaxID=426757 RepID=UPI00203F2754|nr:hypothetical protein [Bhargavaea ginsengi]MCM3088759.1 hypothetical protein [Bhargavaea ginsengi]
MIKTNKVLITVGSIVLSMGFLAGCSSDKETKADSTAIAAEQSEMTLEEKVIKYFEEYELPTEGRVSDDDPLYNSHNPEEYVAYENGYILSKETKHASTIMNTPEGSPEPTPEQIPAVVAGKIIGAAYGPQSPLDDSVEIRIQSLELALEANEDGTVERWLTEMKEEFESISKMTDSVKYGERLLAAIDSLKVVAESITNHSIETNEEQALNGEFLTEPGYEPEIAQFFADYELPEEGQIPKDDPTYQGVNAEQLVAYENGMLFDRSSGQMVARRHYHDGTVPEPTPEQATGVVMGSIVDAASNGGAQIHASQGSAHMIKRLTEAKELNEFESLEEWLDARIEGYKKADALENVEDRVKLLTDENAELNKMVATFMDRQD